MSFSFDDSLATDKDWVRFYIADAVSGAGPRPNAASTNYSDETILSLLTSTGHRVATVATLFEALWAEWARHESMERDENIVADNKGKSEVFARLASVWRNKPDGGGGSEKALYAGVIGFDIAAKGDDDVY